MSALQTGLSEQQIQKSVFAHLRARAVPGALFWHPFSGGFRRPKEAAIYKGLGAIAGLPDGAARRPALRDRTQNRDRPSDRNPVACD
jgi:hypothetical protein